MIEKNRELTQFQKNERAASGYLTRKIYGKD